MICEVWNYLDINVQNIYDYLRNIQIRALLWENINANRRKKNINIVEHKVNLIMNNYSSLLDRRFDLPLSIIEVLDFELKGVLDLETTFTEREKLKMLLMYKVKTHCNETYEQDMGDIDKLISFILEELIDYNLYDFSVDTRCSYISVKSNNKVIVYLSYGYNRKNANSYHFGYYCKKTDLDESVISNSNIIITDEIQVSDACSFKTPILLKKPDLIKDKKLIKYLFEKSKKNIIN